MIPGGNENTGVMATGIVLIFEATAGQVREEESAMNSCVKTATYGEDMVEQRGEPGVQSSGFILSSSLYPALALV